MSKIFRYCKPITLIIDEAVQVTETLVVAIMSRNEHSAHKVVLVGDLNQNKPFTLNTLSEFGATNETSLMDRLMKTGVPATKAWAPHRILKGSWSTVNVEETTLSHDSFWIKKRENHC